MEALVAEVADVEALCQLPFMLPLHDTLAVAFQLRGVPVQDRLAALCRQLPGVARIHHVGERVDLRPRAAQLAVQGDRLVPSQVRVPNFSAPRIIANAREGLVAINFLMRRTLLAAITIDRALLLWCGCACMRMAPTPRRIHGRELEF